MYNKLANFIRSHFKEQSGLIPLHSPTFSGNEKKYVLDAIDSTFVSSVGWYVDKLEEMVCEYTNSSYAVAIVTGTNSLHLSLLLAGVEKGDEVMKFVPSGLKSSNLATLSPQIP